MATLPQILVNGTTADANDVMDDFTEIYSNINSSNVASYTGTALSAFVLQTSPTINTATLSSPTITGVIANAGGSAAAPSYTFTGDLNTGMLSPSADRVEISTGGTTRLICKNGQVNINTGSDFTVEPTSKIYLDGGNNSFIYEASADRIEIVTNGTTRLICKNGQVNINTGSDFTIEPTAKFYLDGGGDTYWSETAANIARLRVGGVDSLSVNATYVSVESGVKLGLDGNVSAGDTYFIESSANVLDAYAGGTNILRLSSTTATVGGSLTLSSGTLTATGATNGTTHNITSSSNVGGAVSVQLNATAAGAGTAVAIDVRTNGGAGAIGIDFNNSTTFQYFARFTGGQMNGAALGAYQGKILINVGGTGYYFPVYA